MAQGNDLLFGVLQGLRVVPRPRSVGPLRQTGAPAPASGSTAADASSPGTSAPHRPTRRFGLGAEKVQISAEARALADQDENAQLQSSKRSDQEVRQHEHAHPAAGGSLVAAGASFETVTGPDGRQYAVSGEVQIDASPVPGDPAILSALSAGGLYA